MMMKHWPLIHPIRCHHFHFSLSCIGEGNGNPLQCSCLETPRDGGAWWAAVYGVAQSRTWLKWPSSSSSNLDKRGSNDVVGTEACIERKWNMRDIWGVFPKRDERNAELWYFLIYELCKLLYKHKIPHHIFEGLETNFICNHSINKVNVLLFYIYFTVLIHFL